MRRPGSVRPGLAVGRRDWHPVRGQRTAVAVDERSHLRRESIKKL